MLRTASTYFEVCSGLLNSDERFICVFAAGRPSVLFVLVQAAGTASGQLRSPGGWLPFGPEASEKEPVFEKRRYFVGLWAGHLEFGGGLAVFVVSGNTPSQPPPSKPRRRLMSCLRKGRLGVYENSLTGNSCPRSCTHFVCKVYRFRAPLGVNELTMMALCFRSPYVAVEQCGKFLQE